MREQYEPSATASFKGIFTGKLSYFIDQRLKIKGNNFSDINEIFAFFRQKSFKIKAIFLTPRTDNRQKSLSSIVNPSNIYYDIQYMYGYISTTFIHILMQNRFPAKNSAKIPFSQNSPGPAPISEKKRAEERMAYCNWAAGPFPEVSGVQRPQLLPFQSPPHPSTHSTEPPSPPPPTLPFFIIPWYNPHRTHRVKLKY
jgi:hypothetical protein